MNGKIYLFLKSYIKISVSNFNILFVNLKKRCYAVKLLKLFLKCLGDLF